MLVSVTDVAVRRRLAFPLDYGNPEGAWHGTAARGFVCATPIGG